MTSITFGGLASGLDTGAIIEQLLAVEARPLQRLDQRRASLVGQQGQFGTFRSKLQNLEKALTDLSDAKELSLFNTTTSDDTKVRVSGSAGANPGAFDVEVTQLATSRSEAFAFDDIDTTTFGDGKLNFTVNGETTAVTVDATDTVQDIRDKINSGDAGVRATIINDGSQFQLVISSEKTGADNRFTVTTDGFNGIDPLTRNGPGQVLEAGDDAIFSIDGLTITSDSNDVDDSVDGLTFELLGTTESGTPVEVSIARDVTAIGDRLNEVAEAYNDVLTYINSQDRSDVALRGVKSQLQSTFQDSLDSADGFSLTALSQIGFETVGGRLQLNRSDLEDAIDDDFNAFLEVFTGKADGSATGFAERFDEVFNGYTDDNGDSFSGILSSGDGTLVLRENSIADRIRSIDSQIKIAERRLDRSEQSLTRRFAAFESLQAQLQSQGAFLGTLG